MHTTQYAQARTLGFTLMELMAVVAIIVLVMAFMKPAITSLKSASDVTSTISAVSGLLEQARSYAMANNTFVWVGFKELDASQNPSVSPQNPGTGRLAIAVVASRDGTRGYDGTSSALANPAWTNYNNGASLVALGKLQRFDNVHLAIFLNGYGNQPPTSGSMARPYIQSNYYIVGSSESGTCVTPFDWPLGSALNSGQYSFKIVVNFDPQGIARIQYASNSDFVGTYMEVSLQQTRGPVISASPNVAAIQVNCMSGSVRLFRP